MSLTLATNEIRGPRDSTTLSNKEVEKADPEKFFNKIAGVKKIFVNRTELVRIAYESSELSKTMDYAQFVF